MLKQHRITLLQNSTSVRNWWFLCLLIASSGWSQILDTSDAHTYKQIEVYSLSERNLKQLKTDSIAIDTSLLNFPKFYSAYEEQYPFLDLGLEGSANLDIGKGLSKNYGFSLTNNPLEHYFFNDDIHIYHTPKPYTHANYSQGNNELIFIELTHAQQISERLTFGLDYRRLKNQNRYYANIDDQSTRRMTNLFNSKFYTGYYTADRRYELLASYLWNRGNNTESGGMKADSLFDEYSGRTKLENNDAWHTSASSTIAQNSFKVTQFFRPEKPTDTLNKGSINPFHLQFFLTTQLNNWRVEYEDTKPDSNAYNYVTDLIHDSVYWRSFYNEFGITLKSKIGTITPSVSLAQDRIYNNGKTVNYTNIDLHGIADINIKGFEVNGIAHLGISGYTAGNYQLMGEIKIPILERINLTGGITSERLSPNLLDIDFNSEIQQWQQSFTVPLVNTLFAKLKFNQRQHVLEAKVGLDNATNPLFYDSDSLVKQFNGNVSLARLGFNQSSTFKHFGFANSLLLQTTSNSNIIPRPAASISSTVYSSFSLFKKALYMQLGARGFYYSSFNAQRYIAYTRNWNIQQQSFTSYPLFNVFVNAKIKNFNMGVTAYHITEQLLGDSYRSSPTYPLMPRSIRLNIKWDFLN